MDICFKRVGAGVQLLMRKVSVLWANMREGAEERERE